MSNQILLALCAGCAMTPLPRKGEPLDLFDIPKFVAETMELRGLVVPVDPIRGRTAAHLERFRDEADRAHCPCLTLMQDAPLDFGAADDSATKTLTTLLRAAKLLGCSEVAIRSKTQPENEERAVVAVRSVLQSPHAQDINLLLRPTLDPVSDPMQLMESIKRIGGFHIGAMPSFAHAEATGDGIATLRKLAPYAGAIELSVAGFTKDGEHPSWDIAAFVDGLLSYGYTNKFALSWEGKTNWVAGIERARERLMQLLGREDPVA